MLIAACRWCGRTSLAAVVRAGNNLSLMPTGACRGTSDQVESILKAMEQAFNLLHLSLLCLGMALN